MSQTFFELPAIVTNGTVSATVWMAPGQTWTRFEELDGIVILQQGNPPLHARVDEGNNYMCTPLTVH